jgi:hypothetical protein
MNQVSPAMRRKWDARIAFLKEHQGLMTAWELGLLDSCSKAREGGRDLSMQRSIYLSETFHRVEEAIG